MPPVRESADAAVRTDGQLPAQDPGPEPRRNRAGPAGLVALNPDANSRPDIPRASAIRRRATSTRRPGLPASAAQG